MVEVEVPLEVADHLVTVGTLLLQWLAQVNSLHVQSEVAAAVGLVVALVTPVVEDLLVDGVDVFVEQLLPLEHLLTEPALHQIIFGNFQPLGLFVVAEATKEHLLGFI